MEEYNSPPSSWMTKIKAGVDLVTVEPTMFLYMMAFMVTAVVEQQFFVHKSCTVNHNLTKSICDNITAEENKEYNKEVQLTVTNFHLLNNVLGHVVPIILAFFMGAWSDKRGRKLPMLMGLVGKFYYSVMIVVNAMQDDWPLEYVIYTATIPSTLSGADVAIFAAAFSYISDVSTKKNRTIRVTILDVCYLSTMPIGVALGSILFNKVVNRSYAIMFTINASLLALAILYTLIKLKWRTTERQRPLYEANNWITDFFDRDHVVQSFKTLLKKRSSHRRAYLLMLIAAMGFYTFQRDESDQMYLYLQLTFKWHVSEYSNFRTFRSTLQVLFMLFGIPVMSKLFGWRDTVIIMIGATSHAIARIYFATAQTEWLIYLGGALAAVGPIVGPVIRSMVSKLVPITERGKVFSLLSVADNAIPLISGVAYSQIYKLTIDTHPQGIFYLTIATQGAVFLILLIINFSATESELIHEEDEDLVVAEARLKEDPETNALNQ